MNSRPVLLLLLTSLLCHQALAFNAIADNSGLLLLHGPDAGPWKLQPLAQSESLRQPDAPLFLPAGTTVLMVRLPEYGRARELRLEAPASPVHAEVFGAMRILPASHRTWESLGAGQGDSGDFRLPGFPVKDYKTFKIVLRTEVPVEIKGLYLDVTPSKSTENR